MQFKSIIPELDSVCNLVEKRLADNKVKIEKLSLEELQDLHKILQLADYLLCKHEESKSAYPLLKDFVDVIHASFDSISHLGDDLDELAISATSLVKEIKDIQGNMTDRFTISSKNLLVPQNKCK